MKKDDIMYLGDKNMEIIEYDEKDLETIDKEKYNFQSLAPMMEKNKDNEIYYQALSHAIDDLNNKDIAVTGVYGSGKSSILKSYFNEHENKKTLFISLGSFNILKDKNNVIEKKSDDIHVPNDVPVPEENPGCEMNSSEISNQILEKSILQQLLYTVKETDVPLSKFKRISKSDDIKWNSCNKVLQVYSLLFLLIFCLMFFINPISLLELLKNICNYKSIIFIVIVCFIIGYFLSLKIFSYCKKNIILSKIKIKDAEIELSSTNESVFNKYLDEILYFFEVTEYDVLVIEDLDRHENIEFIFSKLKELNQILNNSKQVNKRIVFIYAVRDNLFKTFEERTKFFDFIIPILPISSNSNSNERLNELFGSLEDKTKAPSAECIKDIYFYISDMRTIKNIFNEYLIYINRINLEHINNDRLFSMILYKNIYPEKFYNLQQNKGKIFDIFENKNSNIKKCIINLDNNILEYNNEIKDIKNEHLTNNIELKRLLLYSYNKIINPHNILTIKSDGSQYTAEQFFNEEFDFISFLEGTISIVCNQSSFPSDITLNEDSIFNQISKEKFKDRFEVIEKMQQTSLKEISDNIEKLEKEKQSIYKLSLAELIQKYNFEIFTNISSESCSEDLENFLIKRGYIDETYKDYINIFIEGNLSRRDKDYILLIKNDRNVDENTFDYNFDNVNNVVNELTKKDFESDLIYNNEIITQIIKTKENVDYIFNEVTDNVTNFIFKYDDIQVNNEFKLFILNKQPNFIEKIIEIMPQSGVHWINEFLNHEKYIERLNVSSKKVLIEFLNSFSDEKSLIYFNENQILALKKLNIKFKKYVGNKIKKVYENELYELNQLMIKLVLDFHNVDLTNYEIKNYTVIVRSGVELLVKHLKSNFSEYMSECYSNLTNQEDDIELIIELLNDISIMTNELSTKIIFKEKFTITNILDIENEELYDGIFENDKILPHFENIYQFYRLRDNTINDILNNFIKNNIDIIIINSELSLIPSKLDDFKNDNNFKNDLLLLKCIEISQKIKLLTLFETSFEDINEIVDQLDLRLSYFIAMNSDILEDNKEIYVSILKSVNVQTEEKQKLLIKILESNLAYNEYFDSISLGYEKLKLPIGGKVKLDDNINNHKIVELIDGKSDSPISTYGVKEDKIVINLKRAR